MASACSDCSTGEGRLLPLRCKQHRICQDCALSRWEQEQEDTQKCAICEFEDSPSTDPPLVREQPEPGVWIYVDDSNIWIEAKKLASKKRGFETAEDHRVRIDIGKLTEVVADGRRVEQGFLYGSEPPPIDTVWEKIKKHGWAVDTKRRHRISGKEKKVDTQLVVDVTEKACTTPVEQRSTIILITGDADMLPAIMKVQEYKGWSVEVHMWEHALSAELKALHSKEDSVTRAFSLDSYLEKITFTNMKFNLRENRHLLLKVEAFGIVFSMTPGVFQNRVPTKTWCSQVESIAQWPFQYYWFEEHHRPTDDLVLVFREDRQRGRKQFDVKQFLDTIKLLPLPFVNNVQTFLQYSQVKSGLWKTVHGVGHYSWDDVLEVSDSESLSDGKVNPGWKLARNEPRKPKQQRYSEPCAYSFTCRFGSKCWNKHAKEEMDFFHSNMGKGNPVWKVKPCSFFPGCKKREDCPYAHGEDDAWCLICRKRGHFTDKCQANE